MAVLFYHVILRVFNVSGIVKTIQSIKLVLLNKKE